MNANSNYDLFLPTETTQVNIDWTLVADDLIDEKAYQFHGSKDVEGPETPPVSPKWGAASWDKKTSSSRSSSLGSVDLAAVSLQLADGTAAGKTVDYRVFLNDESLSRNVGGQENPVNFDRFYQNLRLLEHMFSYLDKDNDGHISKEEFQLGFRLAMQSIGAEEKLPEVDDVFEMFDHNKDGRINRNEFFEGFRLVGLAKYADGDKTLSKSVAPPKIPVTTSSFELSEAALQTAANMTFLEEKFSIDNSLAFILLCDAEGDVEKASTCADSIQILQRLTGKSTGRSTADIRKLRKAVNEAKKIRIKKSLMFDYPEVLRAEEILASSSHPPKCCVLS